MYNSSKKGCFWVWKCMQMNNPIKEYVGCDPHVSIAHEHLFVRVWPEVLWEC